MTERRRNMEQKNVTDQIPHAANALESMNDKTRRASFHS